MTRSTTFFLLLASFLLMSHTTAMHPPRRELAFRNHHAATIAEDNSKSLLLNLRGGDLGAIHGKSLAKVFSVLASSDAICGALIPRTSMKYFGIYIAPGSLSNKYIHGIGASAATIAVASYLAVNGNPLQQALGYGFAARLVSMTLMILTDTELKVGMNFSMFGTMWLVLATTVYALFTNSWEPLTLTKIVSLVLGMHGLFLYLKPEVFLKKDAISIGPDVMVKEILSIDGGYMFASGVLTGLLAIGMDPVKAVGYTAIAFIPVFLKWIEIIDTDAILGLNSEMAAILVSALMALIIVGTLH